MTIELAKLINPSDDRLRSPAKRQTTTTDKNWLLKWTRLNSCSLPFLSSNTIPNNLYFLPHTKQICYRESLRVNRSLANFQEAKKLRLFVYLFGHFAASLNKDP